jgi:hypothetical protein
VAVREHLWGLVVCHRCRLVYSTRLVYSYTPGLQYARLRRLQQYTRLRRLQQYTRGCGGRHGTRAHVLIVGPRLLWQPP